MSVADFKTPALSGVVAAFASIVLAVGLSILAPCAYATEGDLVTGQVEWENGQSGSDNSSASNAEQTVEGSEDIAYIAYTPVARGEWAYLVPHVTLPDPVNDGTVQFRLDWQWSPTGVPDSWQSINEDSLTDMVLGQQLEVLTNDETVGTWRRFILTVTLVDGKTKEQSEQVSESLPVQIEKASGFRIELDYEPPVAGEIAVFTAKAENDPDDKEKVDLEKIYYEWQMSIDCGLTWIGEGDANWPELLKKQSGVGCSTLYVPTKKIEENESTSEDSVEDGESASDGNVANLIWIRVIAHHDGMKTPSGSAPLTVYAGTPSDSRNRANEVIAVEIAEPDETQETIPDSRYSKTNPTHWSRLFGDTALDTMRSIVCNGFSSTGGTVVVATLDGYWDALAAAGLAGLANAPVLMTEGTQLSKQTRAELERLAPSKVLVCGGPAAVSDDVCSQIKSVCGVIPHRLYGANAVATATDINKQARVETYADWSGEAFLCTSDGYWDALAVAPLAYALHMPIFLTESDGTLPDATLATIRHCGITKVHIAGGTAAVPSTADAMLGDLLGERFAGATAVETSALIANFGLQRGMSANQLGVATTNGYWDALAGAALCGKNGSVLVLVNDVNSSTIDGLVGENSLSEITAYVFGGPAAVSDSVLNRLQNVTQTHYEWGQTPDID